jgi:antitoxin component YwqK of YwqJK toxin-antitoxin module
MLCLTGWNRTVCKFVAASLFVTVQQTASAEDSLQLRVPHSFSSAPAAAQLDSESPSDDYDTAASELAQPYDTVEVVRERYPDGKVKIERQVTLDNEGNYVNHGTWKVFSPTETVIAEGQYDLGKRIGSWTRWLGKNDSPIFGQAPFNRFKPPFASQAVFTNGVMDGEWMVVDADNNKMLQVSLSNGKRNGLVLTYLPTGKVFRQASYDQGVPVGDVLEADAKTGELKRVATYIDGRRIVTKTAFYKNNTKQRRPQDKKALEQKKSEEMYLAATTVEKKADNFWNVELAEYATEGEDIHHGPSKMWFASGKVQVEGFYQHGKRSGTFTYWYANGQVAATGEFADDLPSDVWVWWHENGQKAAVGKYDAGKLVDDWRWWSDDGKLANEKTYNGTEATAASPKDVLELGRGPEVKKATARQASDEQTR